MAKKQPQAPQTFLSNKSFCSKVRRMATRYLTGNYTYKTLGEKYGIARSTVWKYFSVYLPIISPVLAKLVNLRATLNLEMGREKGLRIMIAKQKSKKK